MIKLLEEERNYIISNIKDKNLSERAFIRANCLLLLEHSKIIDIANTLKITTMTVRNIQKRYINKGIKSLYDKERKIYESKLNCIIGVSAMKKEEIIALAKSKPPFQRKRWSLRLLKKFIIQNHIIEQISIETIRKILKDNKISPGDTWFK
jgi:intergrase/recombinase